MKKEVITEPYTLSDHERQITRIGNPGHPEGEAGEQMLERMNRSHDSVTNWGLRALTLAGNPEKLLDIGCGGGATLQRLQNRYPEAVVYGIDHSAVSVKTSMEFNKEAVSAGRMHVQEASVEALPFAENTFDGITTVESFYFWPNHAENLKEVYRILKPGGRFVLIADVFDNGQLPEQILENMKRYHLFSPTPGEFERLFAGAGFAHVSAEVKPGTTWIRVSGEKEEK